MQVNPITGPE